MFANARMVERYPGRLMGPSTAARFASRRGPKDRIVNRIIWVVGLVVIVLFIAGYFGLR